MARTHAHTYRDSRSSPFSFFSYTHYYVTIEISPCTASYNRDPHHVRRFSVDSVSSLSGRENFHARIVFGITGARAQGNKSEDRRMLVSSIQVERFRETLPRPLLTPSASGLILPPSRQRIAGISSRMRDTGVTAAPGGPPDRLLSFLLTRD